MNSFQSYDRFRLKKYLKRKPNIEVEEKEGFCFHLFDEVDYFNYIFFHSSEYNKNDLLQVFLKYKNYGKKTVKIVIPAGEKGKYSDIIDDNPSYKKIVCTQRIVQDMHDLGAVEKVLSKVKTKEEVRLFTDIYLQGFGAEDKDVDEVCENFMLLFASSKVDFFFINENKEVAGICVSFYDDQHVSLAACVIKESFRNKGLQKKAIQERVYLGVQKGYHSFSCWGYKDGVSHQNMLKSNFSNYSIYEERLSKSLDYII